MSNTELGGRGQKIKLFFMKKLLSFFVFVMFSLIATAQVSKTINLTSAGTLYNKLTTSEKSTVTKLTITGSINAVDFLFLRDKMSVLKVLDLSAVNINEHVGYGGTVTISTTYPANEIPKQAFRYKNLTEVVMPTSIVSIGDSSFYRCSISGTIEIPATVSKIGTCAFAGCNYVTGFIIKNINSDYSTDSRGVIFNKLKTILIQFPAGLKVTYTIPNTVKTIGIGAFYDCKNLTGSLNLPNSINTIEKSAFENCTGLTGSLTIPNSVTYLGEDAFAGCTGFNGALTLSNSINTIKNYTFQMCSGFIGSLNIPNSVNTIEYLAFAGCSGFDSLVLPNSLTTIEHSAFASCSGFKGNLTIPNSVQIVGNSAFSGCSGFDGKLTISNSITTIGTSVFNWCSMLSGKVDIPLSVTKIEPYAFLHCEKITELNFGKDLNSIEDRAFQDCFSLTKINISNPLPPMVYQYTFNLELRETCTVYIPIGSKKSYMDIWWGGFMNFVEQSTDIKQNNINKLKLYPNPIIQDFKIGGLNGIAHLSITDLNGKIQFEKQIESSENISINNLPKGVYFAKIITNEGVIERKIIKK